MDVLKCIIDYCFDNNEIEILLNIIEVNKLCNTYIKKYIEKIMTN